MQSNSMVRAAAIHFHDDSALEVLLNNNLGVPICTSSGNYSRTNTYKLLSKILDVGLSRCPGAVPGRGTARNAAS